MDMKLQASALLLLRTLQDNSSLFSLKCDNLVLYKQDLESASIINIKCSNDLRAISTNELLAEDGDFSIASSFIDIVRLQKASDLDNILFENYKKVKYVVYTNRLIDSSKFLIEQSDKVIFLHSTTEYKLDCLQYLKYKKYSQDEDNLLKEMHKTVDVYCVVEQFPDDIVKAIEEEFFNLLRSLKVKIFDLNLISNGFIKYISKTEERLTKSSLCLEISKLLISTYKTNEEIQSNYEKLSNVSSFWKSIKS